MEQTETGLTIKKPNQWLMVLVWLRILETESNGFGFGLAQNRTKTDHVQPYSQEFAQTNSLGSLTTGRTVNWQIF